MSNFEDQNLTSIFQTFIHSTYVFLSANNPKMECTRLYFEKKKKFNDIYIHNFEPIQHPFYCNNRVVYEKKSHL